MQRGEKWSKESQQFNWELGFEVVLSEWILWQLKKHLEKFSYVLIFLRKYQRLKIFILYDFSIFKDFLFLNQNPGKSKTIQGYDLKFSGLGIF
jgi:hypothetical protein